MDFECLIKANSKPMSKETTLTNGKEKKSDVNQEIEM